MNEELDENQEITYQMNMKINDLNRVSDIFGCFYVQGCLFEASIYESCTAGVLQILMSQML